MPNNVAPREFHVSSQSRDRYQFDQTLFTITGNVIIPNFQAAHTFAHKMNLQRDLIRFPEQTVRAGDINAMGLIDEILHYVMHTYRRQRNPRILQQAIDWLYSHLGKSSIDQTLYRFAAEFPPVAVYRGNISLEAYLEDTTDGEPNRQIVLEEMIMLWLANLNPAFQPFLELFEDVNLERQTVYSQVMPSLREFFDTQPRFGPDNQNLIDMLRAPALASPNSLQGQLEFIRTRWGVVLAGTFFTRLLSSLDLIREEQAWRWLGAGPAQVPVYDYRGAEFEPERFSPDLDWMPRLVLIAKNAYVWLHQLSVKYGRAMSTLDQVPDEELDTLARWGMTGLWLIGVWERSPASQRIKQMMGNPEAVASAYSVFDYQIAGDLGGEAAMQNLRERAWRRGIRLASDMVPNHMAIDSRWVVEHPDWFIGLDHSPFPSYSFNGPDLSWDSRVGIFLEDHYYDRTDAAVVFKRLDKWTGSAKYIYHGNDGTSFPWNDTAQLNYLQRDVREAVIQTILHVARQFPVIRFDAAMTLAKKHFERLWFPEPGTGGAIPSRSEFGMTKAEFDSLMPEEFWREVVDRIAAEAPGTLLLAEAFWLMEGYFVRTLGMHRVYNSAFMNMLRDEDNAKYRQVMKNTLEFEPEVLKRYVNFMNNPDERTAVDQFGKGDKYFGICTLMATLPGLPMFGHGQIEGYAEKYGMEYRRAYWDERPDPGLIERHQREIFPLLRRRYLFAGVENFLLYDVYTAEGTVNEDVFAYSNCAGEQKTLVLYHNKFATARGWIRTSAAYSVKTGQGDERTLVQRALGEGLGVRKDPSYFVVLRDLITDAEYIRNSLEVWDKGLYVELNAYQRHVFVDIREVQDDETQLYARLAARLGGSGVSSIAQAAREQELQPVLVPFGDLVNPGMFRYLLDQRVTDENVALNTPVVDETEQKLLSLLRALKSHMGGSGDPNEIAETVRLELEAVLRLPTLPTRFAPPRSRKFKSAVSYLDLNVADNDLWTTLFGWLIVHKLGSIMGSEQVADQSRAWVDELLFGKILADTFRQMGMDEDRITHALIVIRLLTRHQHWFEPEAKPKKVTPFLEGWLKEDGAQQFCHVHRFNGVVWFNKEAFEELVRWMLRMAVIEITADPLTPADQIAKEILAVYAVVEQILTAEEDSQYQLDKLLSAARQIDTPKYKPRAPRERAARKHASEE